MDPVLDHSLVAEAITALHHTNAIQTDPNTGASGVESPNSRGPTPEPLDRTVIHRPADFPEGDPLSPIDEEPPQPPPPPASPLIANASHSNPASPAQQQPILDAASPVENPVEPEDDRNSFEEFLDTVNDELQLVKDSGRKKIDVILYRGHEFRQDRAAEAEKPVQLWICRHSYKYKCKGKLKIRVVDYNNFIEGATVQQYVGHNHNPHQIEPTSLVDVSIISDQSGIQTNDTSRDVAAPLSPVISDPEATSPKRPTHGSEVSVKEEDMHDTRDSHAISRISDRSIAADFTEGNLDSRVRSSPVGDLRTMRPAAPDEAASPSLDLTTVVIDTSQKDTRGYTVRKFVPCQREKPEEDSSDEDA